MSKELDEKIKEFEKRDEPRKKPDEGDKFASIMDNPLGILTSLTPLGFLLSCLMDQNFNPILDPIGSLGIFLIFTFTVFFLLVIGYMTAAFSTSPIKGHLPWWNRLLRLAGMLAVLIWIWKVYYC